MSSKGDPGGNVNGRELEFETTVCVVDIFTTEGINFSAKSAKDSGTDCAFEKYEKLKFRIKIKIVSLIFFISALYIIYNYKTYYCKN
tara:strand:+ start:364 stop:624 length:261 start_codon:yes stop_codon:yes gene_type:complete